MVALRLLCFFSSLLFFMAMQFHKCSTYSQHTLHKINFWQIFHELNVSSAFGSGALHQFWMLRTCLKISLWWCVTAIFHTLKLSRRSEAEEEKKIYRAPSFDPCCEYLSKRTKKQFAFVIGRVLVIVFCWLQTSIVTWKKGSSHAQFLCFCAA